MRLAYLFALTILFAVFSIGTGFAEQGFDYQAYLSANPDLPITWTKPECITHYKLFGFQEKRAVSFNPDEYLNANPDLPTNWTYEEALTHYNVFGKNENRLLAFDAHEYLSLYPDLPQDWTYDKAFNHYLYFGRQEGRIASFDETAYLELYSDLPRDWGQDEAFSHYLIFGKNEGRVYDPYDEDIFLRGYVDPELDNSQNPNLDTSYIPINWSEQIVVSTVTGTSVDADVIHDTDTLYIDWAVLNNSDIMIDKTFWISLYVDGQIKNWWFVTELQAHFYTSFEDYSIDTLSIGTHTIELVADSSGDIDESDETDNTYTKTIIVSSIESLPSAPIIGAATAGDGQARVSFTAPTSDGGSDITGFIVTSKPGGITASGTESPITVTGLTNDTLYTFTVQAENAVGIGPASDDSNSVTPVASTGAYLHVTNTLEYLAIIKLDGFTIGYVSPSQTVLFDISPGVHAFYAGIFPYLPLEETLPYIGAGDIYEITLYVD